MAADENAERVAAAKETADTARAESEERSTVHTDEAAGRLSSEIHTLRGTVEDLVRTNAVSRKKARQALITAGTALVALALSGAAVVGLWIYVQEQNDVRDEVLCPLTGLFVDAGKRSPVIQGQTRDQAEFRTRALKDLDDIYSSGSIDCPPR